MPRIGDLQDKPTTLPVPFGETTLTVEYRPLSYTVKEMRKIVDSKDPAMIVDSIKRLVTKWDLEDADGVVPLDHPLDDDGKVREDDPLLEIPTNIFTGIMKAVQADQSVPGEAGRP